MDEDVGGMRVTPGAVSSGYEGGCSNSSSTGGSEVLGSVDGERQEHGYGFWLVLRVLQHQAEVYFQLRSVGQYKFESYGLHCMSKTWVIAT